MGWRLGIHVDINVHTASNPFHSEIDQTAAHVAGDSTVSVSGYFSHALARVVNHGRCMIRKCDRATVICSIKV